MERIEDIDRMSAEEIRAYFDRVEPMSDEEIAALYKRVVRRLLRENEKLRKNRTMWGDGNASVCLAASLLDCGKNEDLDGLNLWPSRSSGLKYD